MTCWNDFLDARQKLDLPDGWRSEIVEWRVCASPPRDTRTCYIAGEVHDAVAQAAPDDSAICEILGVAMPHRIELFVPDLVVVPRAELRNRLDAEAVPAEKALLVVEITSEGSVRVDRTTKRCGYAHAGVPIYVLIDRFHEVGPSVSVLTDPVGGRYRELVRKPFGKPVTIPEPFGFELDTGEF